MSRTWKDPRDSKTWNITVEGRGAVVGEAQVQLLVFRGGDSALTTYDGPKELHELTDDELVSLLEAALGEQEAS